MLVVWQLSVINFRTNVLIKGTIINSNTDQIKNRKLFKHFKHILKTYSFSTLQNEIINIECNKSFIETRTNNVGNFEVLITKQSGNCDKVSIYFRNKNIKIIQKYPYIFKYSDSEIGVISDIDDTVLISHTKNIFKRIRRILFVTPHKRKAVEYVYKKFEALNVDVNNIFYVSKSESNLFYLITSFINERGLPKGVVLLSNFLSFKALIKQKDKNYKYNIIKKIITNSKEKKFILFGDDTQKDIPVYLRIVKEFPDNIQEIYIHKTKKKLSKNKMNQLNNLRSLNINVTYFT